jgi:hypothetical protein
MPDIYENHKDKLEEDRKLAAEHPIKPGPGHCGRMDPEVYRDAIRTYGKDVVKPDQFEKGGYFHDMQERYPHIAAGARGVDPKARGRGKTLSFGPPPGGWPVFRKRKTA